MTDAQGQIEARRSQVRDAYSAIAARPADEHPFLVGRQLAEALGYPADRLAALPPAAVDAFAGVSCVPCTAEIPAGSRVLDLGCGAGLDSLFAAEQAGSVLGVDFSETMLGRARAAAEQAGAQNVEFRLGAAEAIPAETASVDVALVNGIFNLNPARERIFAELARVIRPGGVLYAAELILRRPLPPDVAASATSWFA